MVVRVPERPVQVQPVRPVAAVATVGWLVAAAMVVPAGLAALGWGQQEPAAAGSAGGALSGGNAVTVAPVGLPGKARS